MDPETLALYNNVASDNPFKVVIRKVLVDHYFAFSSDVQKRAFRRFARFLQKLEQIRQIATSDDWKAFALANKPTVLGGLSAYQAVEVFWAKVAELLGKVASADEAKKIVVNSVDDTIWPDFWAAVWRAVLALCVVIGASLWYLVTTAASIGASLFWAAVVSIGQVIFAGARAVVMSAYELLLAAPRATWTIAESLAVLRAPVLAAGNLVFETAWAASGYAVFFFFLRRLIRRSMIAAGINPEFEEVGELPAQVLNMDQQVRFLSTRQITDFRDSLQAELQRTAAFREPSLEDTTRLAEYNRELLARSVGEPIATDIPDAESELRSGFPVNEEERARISQIQEAIRPQIEQEAKGLLTAEETEAAIRNEAFRTWEIESGLDPPSVFERLPAGSAYRNFREFRSDPRVERPIRTEPVPDPLSGSITAIEQQLSLEYPNISRDWITRLANEEAVERARLELLQNDSAALSRALREIDDRPPSLEGGLAVSTARRERLRRLAAAFEANEIKYPDYGLNEPIEVKYPAPTIIPAEPEVIELTEIPAVRPQPSVPAEILEELSLRAVEERPAGLVLNEADVWVRAGADLVEIPRAPPLQGGFRAITPALVESCILGAQVVLSLVALIIGIVARVQDEQARQDAQAKLDEAARTYQTDFDSLALQLGITDLPKFHRDHRQPLDFSPDAPQTEIPRLFRFGELGIAYLRFRIQFRPAFPSIAEGLIECERLWGLLSEGYLRIWPGQVVWGNLPLSAIYGKPWQDVLNVYAQYSEDRRASNWSSFERLYVEFLQRHGASENLRANFQKNLPEVYWSQWLTPTTSLVVPEIILKLAKRVAQKIEVVLAILALYLSFERNRTDRSSATNDLTTPTRALPDAALIQYKWFLADQKALALPLPTRTFIAGLERASFVGNLSTRYGSISFTMNASVVAYSVPSLSCILLASEFSDDMLLLTPGGSSEVLGLMCNALPVYANQNFSTGELTVSFLDLQDSTPRTPTLDQATEFVTFSGTNLDIVRCQIGNKTYVPVAPRSFQRPSAHFKDLGVPEDSLVRLAYTVLLNEQEFQRQMDQVPGDMVVHKDFLRTGETYDNAVAFALGTKDVGLLQTEGPGGTQDWQLTATVGQNVISIQPLYFAAAAITVLAAIASATPPGFWAALFSSTVAMGGLLVSKLSPLRTVLSQYIIVPVAQYTLTALEMADPTALVPYDALSTYPAGATWGVLTGFDSVTFASSIATTSVLVVSAIGKVAAKGVVLGRLLGPPAVATLVTLGNTAGTVAVGIGKVILPAVIPVAVGIGGKVADLGLQSAGLLIALFGAVVPLLFLNNKSRNRKGTGSRNTSRKRKRIK